MSKKVAIVGCADSKKLVPFSDKTFEIWGVNNLYSLIPRASRWFEIHEITKMGETYLRREDKDFRGQTVNDYLTNLGKWTKEHDCPVYMQKKWPDIVPTSIEYPVKEITEKYGRYFTNSISWQIALAIHEGFDTIGIWGVDMAVDTEYHHQRPSCEYFIGLARGMGIDVYVPSEADLLKTRFLYGFEESGNTAWQKKCTMIKKSMAEKKNKIENEIDIAIKQVSQHEGAESLIEQIETKYPELKGPDWDKGIPEMKKAIKIKKNEFAQIAKIKNDQKQQYIGAESAIKELDKIWS